jgi:transposase
MVTAVLGTKARVFRPIAVSLESLIPPDHFYRFLEAKLDLSFVREWVRDCYAAGGRPSIDPVVFWKLQLAMFFEGVRSERQLLQFAADRLSVRWYLGYDLDEPLPGHSSLTRIRQRYGLPIFRRFFERVVELCQEAGLVWGKELFFDATKVRANAAWDSLRPRLVLVAQEHVQELFAEDASTAAGQAALAEVVPAPVDAAGVAVPSSPASPEPLFRLPVAIAAPGENPTPPWNLLESCRLDPNRPASNSYQRKTDLAVSATDPDAAPMKASGERARLGYHDHCCVDGGKARIILHALVTPADVMENEPLLDQLRRVQFRWRLRPEQVVADRVPTGRYGTAENIRALEEAGIRAYVPLPNLDDRTPFFGASRFTYDAAADEYRCPQGEPLHRRTAKYSEDVVVYQAAAATCNACSLKAQCTASDHGRLVRRSFHADYLERVRAYHETAAYAKAMRKRKVWPEPLFAEAKQWHGLRRFRLRGLPNVNSEGLLIAAGQNLKRWLAATGWGRRSAPCGSLTAPAWPQSALVRVF